VRVVWSDKAKHQLRGIHAYIAQDSERYATRMVDRITNRTKQFALFPLSGRMTPEFGDEKIREVIEGPYRIIYQIRPETIVIAAVVHSSSSPNWR
jgi:plasmid stabilization system protein ParE